MVIKPLHLYKGRGALSNPDVRYKPYTTGAIDDGWGNLESEPPPPQTQVYIDTSRTVINRHNSPNVPVEQTVNAYRGCAHGCIYCFARPTHAYLNLSPGLDFETKLLVKPDVANLLRKELSKKNYTCKPISLGTNTDPYQPIEREYKLTRQILELLDECNHPVSIVTKSSLIERDIDILGRMGKRNLARVYISVTTLDNHLWRKLEPRTSAPALRVRTIRRLREAGVPTGVLAAPLIPALNDMDMEKILAAAADAGALWGMYQMLRLPLEVKGLFNEWLRVHYPLRAEHVMNLVREVNGGKYDSSFSERVQANGHYANMMRQRFEISAKKLGLNQTYDRLDKEAFQPPRPDTKQMNLF